MSVDIKNLEDIIKKQVYNYNLLHSLEYYKNYANKKKHNTKKNKNLANYIKNNFTTMDEIELRKMALTCLSVNECKKIVLNHELTYYESNPTNNMTLDAFIKHAYYILNRYQSKAGGFLMEDIEWTLFTNDTTKYDVHENEILFENTISLCDFEDMETMEFLHKLEKRLGYVAKNIKINLRSHIDEKNKLVYILLWAVDQNMKHEKVLGL